MGESSVFASVPDGDHRAQDLASGLAFVLKNRRILAHVALPLPALIDELADWVQSATDRSWRSNKEPLWRETEASAEHVGPRLRAVLTPALASYVRAARRLVSSRDREGDAGSALLQAGQTLMVRLQEPAALLATWEDLVDATLAEDALGAASVAVQLEGQLDAAGRSGPDELDQMTRLLRREGWAVGLAVRQWGATPGSPREPTDEEASQVPAADVLRLAMTMAADQPPLGRVIVWSLYDQASASRVTHEVGSLIMFMPDWAIGRAFATGSGAEDPFVAEVRSLWHAQRAFEDNDDLRNHVLVRIDLGQRSPVGALDAAADVIDTLMDALVSTGSSGRWGKSVWSQVLMDGVDYGSQFGRGSARPTFDDTYGSEIVSDLLEQAAVTFAPALLNNPVPWHLREALRACAEAEHSNSRTVSLYGDWRNGDRTVVLLLDAAFEHVAAVAATTSEALGTLIHDRWPQARRTELISWALRSCLYLDDFPGLRSEEARILDREITQVTPTGTSTSLLVAYRRLDRLVGLTRSRVQAEAVRLMLGQLGDPAGHQAESKRLKSEAELLADRRKRVRNAVAHGNPVTRHVLDSVTEFSRFRALGAVRAALTSRADGVGLGDYLADAAAQHAIDAARMAAGKSQVTLWESESGPQ